MEYILISGATGGLGKALTESCPKNSNLFLLGRDKERLSAFKKELESSGRFGEIITFQADLTKEEERSALFEFADEKSVKFCALLNVAGADIRKPFKDYTDEKLLFQIRLNAEAAIALSLGVIKRRGKELKILAVSSMCGIMPMPYFAVYSATKAAVLNFFTALYYEEKDVGVTVLVPGSIPTREDIKEDIKRQGITAKLSSKPPEFVSKKAMKALYKNKRLIVPGLYNKINYFLQKIIPTPIKCRFMARRWKKNIKDAF
ncbi:MAG: SDR family NAD(P)-dependent oxidoreductase [Clostridia bacterium]|nr:SDR family NAD(P)-dependent oxidoreductase [Clostridia bacterium]